jgi:hypothetical protein
MAHTRYITGLVCIGLFILSGCSGNSPEAPVVKFYTLYLKLHPSGLPTPAEKQAMAPYLSEHLLILIENARSCRNAYIRDHPDDKPPWDDGCLFASVFEGPESFSIKNIVKKPDGTTSVVVRFRYKTAEWEDTVLVRKEAKVFVIDDFVMSGAGPFNPPWRFSEGLECPGK